MTSSNVFHDLVVYNTQFLHEFLQCCRSVLSACNLAENPHCTCTYCGSFHCLLKKLSLLVLNGDFLRFLFLLMMMTFLLTVCVCNVASRVEAACYWEKPGEEFEAQWSGKGR